MGIRKSWQWVNFFLKKFYVMFIGIEFTPHKVGALQNDNMAGPLKDLMVFLSLGLVRLLQIIFIFLSLFAVFFGRREDRLLALIMFCAILAYSAPYLIGLLMSGMCQVLLPILCHLITFYGFISKN